MSWEIGNFSSDYCCPVDPNMEEQRQDEESARAYEKWQKEIENDKRE